MTPSPSSARVIPRDGQGRDQPRGPDEPQAHVALEPLDKGLMGTLLLYPYEVRDPKEYFDDIQDVKVTKDMLDLARHIVDQKAGHFGPENFVDQYETALLDLINQKRAGKPITPKERPRGENVVDLMDALQSTLEEAAAPPRPRKPTKSAKKPRKAAAGQKEMLMPIAGKKQAKETAAKKKPAAKVGGGSRPSGNSSTESMCRSPTSKVGRGLVVNFVHLRQLSQGLLLLLFGRLQFDDVDERAATVRPASYPERQTKPSSIRRTTSGLEMPSILPACSGVSSSAKAPPSPKPRALLHPRGSLAQDADHRTLPRARSRCRLWRIRVHGAGRAACYQMLLIQAFDHLG